MTVTVSHDPHMLIILKSESQRLLGLTDDVSTLHQAWDIVNRAAPAPSDVAALKTRLHRDIDAATEYVLVFSTYEVLRDHAEPPAPPSPELKKLAARLEGMFGMGSRVSDSISRALQS